jgi:hypothetical protein
VICFDFAKSHSAVVVSGPLATLLVSGKDIPTRQNGALTRNFWADADGSEDDGMFHLVVFGLS